MIIPPSSWVEHKDFLRENQEIFMISNLTDRYQAMLKNEAISSAEDYCSPKLKVISMTEWENVLFRPVPGK